MHELPNPFLFDNGMSVTTIGGWHERRTEMLKSLQDIEYGTMPPIPERIRVDELHRHRVKRLLNAQHMHHRIWIEGGAEPFSFIVEVYIPEGKGPFPVVINGDGCWNYLTDDVIMDVLGRGYMIASFNRTEIVPDNFIRERNTGLYRVYLNGDFGAIAAWAWGYHRVVDFLDTEPAADMTKISVVGHSRGGKTVLLAGATDERIALTAPNDSGCCGAGCFRVEGEGSETLKDILKNIPFWFSPKLKEFIGKETELPFDQHFLKALVAPRALLSTEALGDLWANPRGTYQTYLAAREVYRFLDAESRIAIHYREGVHEHNRADWNVFLDYADHQFRGTPLAPAFNWNPFPGDAAAFTWQAPKLH